MLVHGDVAALHCKKAALQNDHESDAVGEAEEAHEEDEVEEGIVWCCHSRVHASCG